MPGDCTQGLQRVQVHLVGTRNALPRTQQGASHRLPSLAAPNCLGSNEPLWKLILSQKENLLGFDAQDMAVVKGPFVNVLFTSRAVGMYTQPFVGRLTLTLATVARTQGLSPCGWAIAILRVSPTVESSCRQIEAMPYCNHKSLLISMKINHHGMEKKCLGTLVQKPPLIIINHLRWKKQAFVNDG